MPRKTTRRERRERQERREEARESGLPVRAEASVPAGPPDRESGISYSGTAGALLGGGLLFFIAAAVLIDAEGSERLWSIAFAIAGLFFVPALIVSLARNHPRREAVLRGATIGCLLIALLGAITFGLGIAIFLAPATALLAIGAGLIFQGPSPKK